MKKIYTSQDQLVGKTPLVELSRLERELGLEARIFVKLEYFNPAGSVKDRVALYMINDAEEQGRLRPGSVIIEPTSGNTGIGLAMVAASRGYRLIIVMPDSMSPERAALMRAYGAEVVLTDGGLGMSGAISRAREIAAKTEDSFIPDQFSNPSNPKAHKLTTGPEIYEDTEGEVDIFVCGVGTGGTVSGVGEYLKSKKPNLKIVAVEPAESPVLSGGKAGPHGIQGIGAGFVPEILSREIIDEIIPVSSKGAIEYARLLGAKEGIAAGISSGAAFAAAVALARRPENRGKNIVVLFPDGQDRYLSSL